MPNTIVRLKITDLFRLSFEPAQDCREDNDSPRGDNQCQPGCKKMTLSIKITSPIRYYLKSKISPLVKIMC